MSILFILDLRLNAVYFSFVVCQLVFLFLFEEFLKKCNLQSDLAELALYACYALSTIWLVDF